MSAQLVIKMRQMITFFKAGILSIMLLAFIVFSPPKAYGLVRPPKTLTDPQATSESKSLMSFLVDYYGQQVLSASRIWAQLLTSTLLLENSPPSARLI